MLGEEENFETGGKKNFGKGEEKVFLQIEENK